jgi:hypothetical protein
MVKAETKKKSSSRWLNQFDFYKKSVIVLSMNFTKTDFQNDLNKATVMGAAAFQRGIVCASASDAEFGYFIKKYSTADWKFTKQLLKLMNAWQRGWTVENLK